MTRQVQKGSQNGALEFSLFGIKYQNLAILFSLCGFIAPKIIWLPMFRL